MFQKAKVIKNENYDEDEEDELQELNDTIDELRDISPSVVPADLSGSQFVDVDANIITDDDPKTDEEIISSVVECEEYDSQTKKMW